jgi:hypothetical protein
MRQYATVRLDLYVTVTSLQIRVARSTYVSFVRTTTSLSRVLDNTRQILQVQLTLSLQLQLQSSIDLKLQIFILSM